MADHWFHQIAFLKTIKEIIVIILCLADHKHPPTVSGNVFEYRRQISLFHL